MKKVTVKSAGGRLELNDERIPEPGSGYVRVKVQACGVCHSDSLTKEGAWPGIAYPRSPGHEIGGVIDALGPGTDPWKVGDRVGVGWYGGNCGKCESCRKAAQQEPSAPLTADGLARHVRSPCLCFACHCCPD